MKSLTEESLNYYLLNKVELRRCHLSKTVEEIQKIILQLTTEISYKDSRFQAISNSNFHNENIKVLIPTQFLVTVPIRGLFGYKKIHSQRWRYYTFNGSKLISPLRDPEGLYQWLEISQFVKTIRQWHENDVTIEGDIVPAKVLQVFRKLVESSIITCGLANKINMLETTGSIIRMAVVTSASQVEVELIPMVEIRNCWSEKSRWPRCLKNWPSRDRVECIKSFGFNLLARSNYHWQLGFCRAEHLLMEGIDEDGGCRKICFQVMRQMKEDVWCPGNKPVITSQHLQAVLFWTCEKYPRAKDWRVFKDSFLRLVRKLYKCVSQHFLKHFFVKGNNMFQYASRSELEAVAQKLTLFLENPEF